MLPHHLNFTTHEIVRAEISLPLNILIRDHIRRIYLSDKIITFFIFQLLLDISSVSQIVDTVKCPWLHHARAQWTLRVLNLVASSFNSKKLFSIFFLLNLHPLI